MPRSSNPLGPAGFTLVELLVVVAIVGLLASLILPVLSQAKEKAKAVKVHVELYGLGMALEMYANDREGQLPPVRVNCNTDLATHWCQFPVELAEDGYLPRGREPGMSANMEDPFSAGHTYKYAAVGPYLLNDSPGGYYRLWVPDDFPRCRSESGKYYSTRDTSPVRWVVWSMGPRPESARSRHSRAPVSAHCWYQRTGEGGLLTRFATQDGLQLKSP